MGHYLFILLLFFNAYATDELCRAISHEALENANREIERTAQISLTEKNYAQYVLRMEKEAEQLAKAGNAKFLKDNKWAMNVSVVEGSGFINKGLSRGEFQGKKWFIKNLGFDYQDIVQEYQNAKKIHALGLGPEAHFVSIEKRGYLVMEEVGGFNIKEIINNFSDPPNLLEKINNYLKSSHTDINMAKKAYAKAILTDKNLLEKMKRYAQRLHDNHFADPYDFQFMIAPQTKDFKRQLAIVDTGGFKEIEDFEKENINLAHTNFPRKIESDPVVQMEKIIKKLNLIAYGY